MTKTKLFAAAALLAAACSLAAQQQPPDARGVTVDLGGAPYLHRSPVSYPREAIEKGVAGTVVAQVKIGPTGEVADASIVSGPDELRRAVLESVLTWHFSKEIAGATRQISVIFQLPKGEPAPSPTAAPAPRATGPTGTVKTIAVTGLSEEARAQLLAQLPIREGETLTPELRAKVAQTIANFDSHLSLQAMPAASGEVTLRIALAGGGGDAPQRIRVGGNVQQSKLVSQPRPIYPPEAKAAGIQGTVSLQAIISPQGNVQQLTVISGDPALVQSAVAAVSQWVYAPTLLNGNPVEVVTNIDVNYTLSK
jgi:TonB family protein